jgi:DHA3 family macrolide efflux protein-like MFS transporter
MGVLRVLRDRRLATLWSSQVLSAMGDYFYAIAVLWIAVRVAGSRAGLVAAAETSAALAFGLLGGVYADRWNRRRVMIVTDLLRAGAVAVLPLLAALGTLQLWQLVLAGILLGGLGALFNPALQASIPTLTGDARTLQATNGLMDLTRRLARAIGPSLAGLVVAVLPLSQFFTLDAVSFVISAGAIASLGSRYAWKPAPAVAQARAGGAGVLAEIAGAVRQVAADPRLAWAFAALGVINVLWAMAFTLGVPLLAAEALRAGVGAYGLIVGAYGVGNVAANLVVGSLPIRRHIVWFFAGKLVLAGGFLLLASAPVLLVALAGSALAAVGGPMGDIPLLTLMQTGLPAHQLGKVFSLRWTLSNGGALLGTLLAVPWFAFAGVRVGIAVCATLMAVTGALGLVRFATEQDRAVPHAVQREDASTVSGEVMD